MRRARRRTAGGSGSVRSSTSPLADFLSSFAGLTLETGEELPDGYDYPKTIALVFAKPEDA